jgi:hypothetical protein
VSAEVKVEVGGDGGGIGIGKSGERGCENGGGWWWWWNCYW